MAADAPAHRTSHALRANPRCSQPAALPCAVRGYGKPHRVRGCGKRGRALTGSADPKVFPISLQLRPRLVSIGGRVSHPVSNEPLPPTSRLCSRHRKLAPQSPRRTQASKHSQEHHTVLLPARLGRVVACTVPSAQWLLGTESTGNAPQGALLGGLTHHAPL